MTEALEELFLFGEEKMEKQLHSYKENLEQSVQDVLIREY